MRSIKLIRLLFIGLLNEGQAERPESPRASTASITNLKHQRSLPIEITTHTFLGPVSRFPALGLAAGLEICSGRHCRDGRGVRTLIDLALALSGSQTGF